MMSNAYQYNKGKSYHPWWSSREDTDSETLVKGYSTLIPVKYNNSDPRNKGSYKTKKSHEKLSSIQLYNENDSTSKKSPHGKLAQILNNKPNKASNAQWNRISSTNISLRLFFFNAHTLVINKSYSNEKLQGMNKPSQITNEHMKPHPIRQPLKLKSLNQCQKMEWREWYD